MNEKSDEKKKLATVIVGLFSLEKRRLKTGSTLVALKILGQLKVWTFSYLKYSKTLHFFQKMLHRSKRPERNRLGLNKTGSSQVGAISKARKYSKNNCWKHLEKLFSKKILKIFFFRKKVFFRKSHNAEKLKKRPFRLIKRFYKPKTSKKCKGLPFDRIRKFSKKVAKCRKKTQRGDPLVSPAVLLEA